MPKKNELNQEQLEKVNGGGLFTEEEMNIINSAYSRNDFKTFVKNVTQAKIYDSDFSYVGIGTFSSLDESYDRTLNIVKSYSAFFYVNGKCYDVGNRSYVHPYACPLD